LKTDKNLKKKNVQVEFKNVSKKFLLKEQDFLVFENLSFELYSGEILGIIGRTGCGKTTVLNLIGGLEQLDAGEIKVTGSVAYIPQGNTLLSWRTVAENILLPLEIQKKVSEKDILFVEKLLEKTSLSEFAKAYPSEISGGMCQKASLIRAFVQNADIFLFDEPFSAIDSNSRLLLGKETRSYILSRKKSALFITHNIEEALSVCDRIIVIGGKPTKIQFQSAVPIPEECRDPITIRKMEVFDDLFEKIWKIINQ
jgi:NitT/TauT family transport system ATP-binding protein